MSRLVAFGCSFTYGHGLADCYETNGDHGPNPSNTSWPISLGVLLGVDEIINCGKPGVGNKFIWKNILDFNFYDDDIVVILWSYIERYCVFHEHWVDHFLPSSDRKVNKFYYTHLYSDLDRVIDFFNRADHIKRYLDNKNIKNFHSTHNLRWYRENDVPKWNTVKLLSTDMRSLDKKFPRALDGSHPGQLAHDQFANDVYLEIKDYL